MVVVLILYVARLTLLHVMEIGIRLRYVSFNVSARRRILGQVGKSLNRIRKFDLHAKSVWEPKRYGKLEFGGKSEIWLKK